MCELLRLQRCYCRKISFGHCYSPFLVISIEKRNYCTSVSLLKGNNFYERLGVKQNATKDEIKKAYINKSKEFHPDKVHGSRNIKSDDTMKELNEAYTVLRNKSERQKYDNKLKPTHQTSQQYRAYNAQQYSRPNSQYQKSEFQRQNDANFEKARRQSQQFRELLQI